MSHLPNFFQRRVSSLPTVLSALVLSFVILYGCEETQLENQHPEAGMDASLADPLKTQKTFKVVGTVKRSVEPAKEWGGNGRGNLYLYLSNTCGHNDGEASKRLFSLDIPEADLSTKDRSIAFEFKGIPEGTYQLNGFLDDVQESADSKPDLPSKGDLVSFGTIAPKCVEVIIRGQDLDGIELDLNYIMPFDLPGVTQDASSSVDAGPISDGGGTFVVSGVVTRSIPPGLGGDGKGPLYMTLTKKCMTNTGKASDLIAYDIFQGADLSGQDSQTPFSLSGVPNGIYFLNGFIDDVTNANAQKPYPGKGDLVSFGGLGPKCLKVVVNGSNLVDVVFDLNMVMPFDL